MSIALISCSKQKYKWLHRAYKLYSKSTLFKKHILYAKKNCKDFYILSAEHGLIDKNKILQDYDYTLVWKSQKELKIFWEKISKQIKEKIDKKEDIMLLAGENYIKYLDIPNKITNPFKWLSIWYRLSKLNKSNRWL